MAKGQMRSNKEVRKPKKAAAAKPVAAASTFIQPNQGKGGGQKKK